MATALARAHIAAEERLRRTAVRAIEGLWEALPGYDRENVDEWLSRVVPVALAAQSQSVAVTESYLARRLGRTPLGINRAELIGAGVRNGTLPAQEWERPFVTLWSSLSAGAAYESAVAAGLARAKGMVAADVQLSMRSTLQAVGEADDAILGYQRVPNPGACEFCELVAGQRYTTDQLMPVHNFCGCGVDVITADNCGDFTGVPENDLSVPGAAVQEHGELGPVLVHPDHDFTQL